MKNEKTQYTKRGSIKLTVFLILLYLTFVVILLYFNRTNSMVVMFISLFTLVPLMISIIGAILGIIKGKFQTL